VYIYLDTETTGLSAARGDKIVELAIVDHNGKILIDTLVDPGIPIPYGASNIHGISDSMVKGQPKLSDLMPQILEIITDNDMVIYNSAYDAPFFPGGLRQCNSINCAMKEFSKQIGRTKWQKLSVAADHVGHTWTGNAHRALADTLACRRVWKWLLPNL